LSPLATTRSGASTRSAQALPIQVGRRQPGIGHHVDLPPELDFDLVRLRPGEQLRNLGRREEPPPVEVDEDDPGVTGKAEQLARPLRGGGDGLVIGHALSSDRLIPLSGR
jgi:hypothetical protein